MSGKPQYTEESLLFHLANVVKENGEDISEAAYSVLCKKKGWPDVSTYRRRVGGSWPEIKQRAIKWGQENDLTKSPEEKEAEFTTLERDRLLRRIGDLDKEINRLKDEQITTADVREYIFGLKDTDPVVPTWMIEEKRTKGIMGIPTLEISDIHYAEIVKPEQVFGTNEYNMTIADKRLRCMTENTIDLLQNHLLPAVPYKGLVLDLAGDLVAGNIHEELTATNETPIMPAFLRLFGILVWVVTKLVNEFDQIAIFSVAGNHGRTTKKTPAKNKAYTNYDWLLGSLLELWFKSDKRVNVRVADGDDLQYRIYNHRYRLTHGDQFRGGSGFIGPYAPITRGEIKKRAAAETIDMNYDTLVMAHFHNLMLLDRVIVNGSVVGYDEYAIKNNFPYTPPKQALWITHPTRGITITSPVFCDPPGKKKDSDTDWVSWIGEEK